ncbi:hypothetical protein GGR07_000415 [Bacteroides pyogenes]|nr:hypothetical protein [Bacteroides pyogenes]SUV31880.1 Uncharacterised protein [Bacteroides pyogenes]
MIKGKKHRLFSIIRDMQDKHNLSHCNSLDFL